RLPPGIPDVPLELDAERALVVGVREPAVNLGSREDEAAALTKRDDGFEVGSRHGWWSSVRSSARLASVSAFSQYPRPASRSRAKPCGSGKGRQHGDECQHERPCAATKEVVILEQFAPGLMVDRFSEPEFEREGERQPEHPGRASLAFGRLPSPFEGYGVGGHRRCQSQPGNLVRCLFAERLPVQKFPRHTV